jgi:hypothetical protein
MFARFWTFHNDQLACLSNADDKSRPVLRHSGNLHRSSLAPANTDTDPNTRGRANDVLQGVSITPEQNNGSTSCSIIISDQSPQGGLTEEQLAIHNQTHRPEDTFCRQISRAIEVQLAGQELNISLPLHCYMPEPFQFDKWIKQQAS